MNSLPNSSPTMPTFSSDISFLSYLAAGRGLPRDCSARGALRGLRAEEVAKILKRDARVLVDLDAALVKARLHRQPAVVTDVQQGVHHPLEVAVACAGREPVVVRDVDVGKILAHLVDVVADDLAP